MQPGTLYLAATPIGNDADASLRLREHLAAAPLIAAEDTRRLDRLAERLGVRYCGEVVSFHEHNEHSRAAGLVSRLVDGTDVLLVTDAGMPSVSDPGYRLVTAAIAAQVPVTCLPGPSAVMAALAVSGLPVDRFCFEGFLPRKSGQRASVLADLAAEPRTLIFFESPHRLEATLAAMVEAFGAQRPAAVCRELTKTYEQIVRGPVAELAAWATDPVRGEIVIVVGGAPPQRDGAAEEAAVDAVAEAVAAGTRLKDACSAVSSRTGVARNVLYDAYLKRR